MLLREKPSSWLVLSTVLLLAAATTFAAHSLVPVFGWDVLDFWAPRVAFKSDEVFRHSDLIPSLLRFLLEISNATVLAVFLSVLLPLAIALLVNDILVLMHISTRIRALAVYGVVTIPLLENHAAIRGYSEIWVVLLLLLGTSGYLRLLLAKKSNLVAQLMLLSTLLLPAVRSSGASTLVCLGAAILISGGWQYICHRYSLKAALIFIGGLCALASIILFPEFRVYRAIDGWRLVMMGYDLILTVNDPSLVISSVKQALFINSTFSIIPASFLAISVSLLTHRVLRRNTLRAGPENRATFFLVILALFLVTRIAVAQFTTFYLFEVSLPGNDILGSRELLPAMVISVVAIALVCGLSRAHRGPIQQE